MAIEVETHIDEETIEKYSRGDLSGVVAAGVEEHFLICELCRKRVEASDAYVTAMHHAAEKLRRSERKPKPNATRKAVR